MPDNGQVERMNRTIKEATIRRFHYDSQDQLRQHLADFVITYNLARWLKTLRGLTPYEAIFKAWTEEPQRFTLNPLHQIPELNILSKAPLRCLRGLCDSAFPGRVSPRSAQ